MSGPGATMPQGIDAPGITWPVPSVPMNGSTWRVNDSAAAEPPAQAIRTNATMPRACLLSKRCAEFTQSSCLVMNERRQYLCPATHRIARGQLRGSFAVLDPTLEHIEPVDVP